MFTIAYPVVCLLVLCSVLMVALVECLAVGRLVREHDRSELLHEAEPVDYSGVQTSPALSDLTSGLYQAGDAGPRPLQQTGGDWSVMSGPSQVSRHGPPRGIFDDV